ncbi:centrosomal protein of 164 kDa-like isoform X2 [Hydractinia symbiolongicarpus]|uniref:centrosomal protein of 164 kDa-like isoform X2 n=1 Tax=Hydractinia symbiolongicarpus TaxID=13093 RepID=UPI00254DC665|nr:centrosomal protein of 164 kDa-like isoform X2 [Hydractinia symbiolongicarpus]
MVSVNNQLILDEEYDENYQPTEEEIFEYAQVIGINPYKEPELLYIARQGIVAPLPPDWKPCQDPSGEIYYFNFSTGDSVWDHPCDEHFRDMVTQEREMLKNRPKTSGKNKPKEKKNKEKKKEKTAKASTLGLENNLGPLKPLGGKLGTLSSTAPSSLGSTGGTLSPLMVPGKGKGMGTSINEKKKTGEKKEKNKTKDHGLGSGGFGMSLGTTGESINFLGDLSEISQYSDGKPKFNLGIDGVDDVANLGYMDSDDDSENLNKLPDKSDSVEDEETEVDFGINSGLAARLDMMSVDNLPAFDTYRDESDESDFDIKQSSTDNFRQLKVENSDQTIKAFMDNVDEERKKRSEMLASAAEKRLFASQESTIASYNDTKTKPNNDGKLTFGKADPKQDTILKTKLNLENEKEDNLEEFKKKLKNEEEEEKKKLRATHDLAMKYLKNEIDEEKLEEEAKLQEDKADFIRKLKTKIEDEKRKEKEQMEKDNEVEVDKLKNKFKSELEKLKTDLTKKNSQEKKDLENKLKEQFNNEEQKLKQNQKNDMDKLKDELLSEKETQAEKLRQQQAYELQQLRTQLQEEQEKKVKDIRQEIELNSPEEMQFMDSLNQSKFNKPNLADFKSKQEDYDKELGNLRKEHEEHIKSLKTAFEEEVKRLKDNQKENVEKLEIDMQNELKSLRQELKDKNEKENVQFQKSHLQEKETLIIKHQSEVKLLQENNEKEVDALKKKFEEEQERYHTEMQELEEQKKKLDGKKEELGILELELQKQEKTQQNIKNGDEETEKADLLNDKSQLQIEIENSKKVIEELEDTISMLQTSKSVIKNDIEELTHQKKKLNDEISISETKFKSDKTEQSKQIEQLKEEIANLEQKIKLNTAELKDYKSQKQTSPREAENQNTVNHNEPSSTVHHLVDNMEPLVNGDIQERDDNEIKVEKQNLYENKHGRSSLSLQDLEDSDIEKDQSLEHISKRHNTIGIRSPAKRSRNQKKLAWKDIESESDSFSESLNYGINDFEKYRHKHISRPTEVDLQLNEEEDAIERARQFLRKNKENIRKRQSALAKAEEEWRLDSLHSEAADINDAMYTIAEGQDFVQRKERNLRLLENALNARTASSPDESERFSDVVEDAEIRYKLRRLREQKRQYDDDIEYGPWIDKATKGSQERRNRALREYRQTYDPDVEADNLYPRHVLGSVNKRDSVKAGGGGLMGSRRSDGDQFHKIKYLRDVGHGRHFGDDEKPRCNYEDLEIPIRRRQTPTVEERLEKKWMEYFGDRLMPSYSQIKATPSWGHSSALDDLRKSTNGLHNVPATTEKRLQSHAEWLKNVRRDRDVDSINDIYPSPWQPTPVVNGSQMVGNAFTKESKVFPSSPYGARFSLADNMHVMFQPP